MATPSLLDLGCGDGYLLERLARRGIEPSQLAGIDMSPDELALARARPALAGASLRCERAQALSLASASVTCAVSHLAFSHMTDLEAVVAELGRVLCPGGVFSAILLGHPRPGAPNAFALFLDHFTRIDDRAARDVPVLVDRRLRSVDGLAAFFHPRAGFDGLAIDDLEVNLDGSAEAVWQRLSGIYEGAAWSAEELATLRARFLADVEALRCADGTVPCRLALRQLTCRRQRALRSDAAGG